MAANRCSTCSLNYPINVRKCWVCNEPTAPIRNAEPSPDWKDEAYALRETMQIASEVAEDIPILDVTLTEREGRLFISSWEVCDLGFHSRLHPDMLITIDDQVYEIVGYISSLREYWVERVTWDADLEAELEQHELPSE